MMLITGFGSPEIEKQVRQLGAFYLPKPFSLQEFIATAHHILDEESEHYEPVEQVSAAQEPGTMIH
jgi:DNA-binding response OmpR family regulator